MAELQGLSTNELITKSSSLTHVVAGKVRVSNMATMSHTANMPTRWMFFSKDVVNTMIFYFLMDLAASRTWTRLTSRLPSIMKTNILSKKMCLFGEL